MVLLPCPGNIWVIQAASGVEKVLGLSAPGTAEPPLTLSLLVWIRVGINL